MPKGPTGGTTAPQRQELFAPFGRVLRTLAGTGADSVRYEVDSARRVQISRLAMTVFGMWDVIVGAEGYDLSRSAPSEPSVSLYDDGMLSYQLTNTIWSWNRLEQRRHHDHDDLDVEIARSLVRFPIWRSGSSTTRMPASAVRRQLRICWPCFLTSTT